MVDVYFYDQIPPTLRVQITHIIRDAIGVDMTTGYYSSKSPYDPYKMIHETLCREYGVFTLGTSQYDKENNEECVLNYFLNTGDVDRAIDIIELTFKYIKRIIGENRQHYKQFFQTKLDPNDAIDDLNERFKENGFGYQFENEMIRVDSVYSQAEIAKPTLRLLYKTICRCK